MAHVYRGYTAEELAIQIDASAGIANLEEVQKRNAVDTERARATIPCRIDVAYGPDPLQKLDIYGPIQKGAGGYPVVIDIHGGGWRAGSKNGRGFPAETLVPKGVVWVTIDYGLAPTHKIDGIVDHVRTAAAWVFKNIAAQGGDPYRITVCGHSAGGHLAGTLLMPGWHAAYGVPDEIFKGVCASSGVYDMEALVGATSGYNDELRMTKADARAHSPIYHLPKQACPLIVAYGGRETDEFKRQSRAFAQAWKDAGLAMTEIECVGDNHFSIARTQVDPASALNTALLKMIGL